MGSTSSMPLSGEKGMRARGNWRIILEASRRWSRTSLELFPCKVEAGDVENVLEQNGLAHGL